MKQWKLVLVALLAVLLVCTSAVALADTYADPAVCHHDKADLQEVEIAKNECEGFRIYNVVCNACGTVILNSVKEAIPVVHNWGAWSTVQEYSCLTDEIQERQCPDCLRKQTKVTKACPGSHNMQIVQTIPATCTAEGQQILVCQNPGCIGTDGVNPLKKTVKLDKVPHVHNLDSTAPYTTVSDATCTVDGLSVNYCQNCGGDPIWKTIPATGHKFDGKYNAADGDTWVKEATCTAGGSFNDKCKNGCGFSQTVEVAAKGHKFPYEWKYGSYVGGVYTEANNLPNCTTALYRWHQCEVCGKTYNELVAPAFGHTPVQKVLKEATATEAGDAHIECAVCGVVLEAHIAIPSKADEEAAKAAEEAAKAAAEEAAKAMYYGSTITGFGPTTRELIGGKTWNRVTPIDLSVEGTFTYPLIAANKYTAGTMTVTIKDGTATVSYKLSNSQIKVKSESLIIYPNLDALKAGSGSAFALNTPIDLAQAFGDDTKVIIALKLVADFNGNGAGMGDFKADAAQISAMTAIID